MLRQVLRLAATALAILIVAPTAQAYVYWELDGAGNPREWCSTGPRVWNDVSHAEFQRTTNLARALWNSVPHVIFMNTGSSSGYEIYVGQYYNLFDSRWGYTEVHTPANGCFTGDRVFYNTAHGHSLEESLKISVHEFGHVLNLDHATVTDVMQQGSGPVSVGITHPSYDAIRGTTNLYGFDGTSFGSSALGGDGAITRTNGFPTKLTATNGRAMAYASRATGSDAAYLSTVWVTPSSLNRYGIGYWSTTDPTNTNGRVGIIELDNDGINGVVTKPNGGLTIKTITSSTATAEYFLQVSMPQEGASGTFRVTMCAWTTSDHSFKGCSVFTESEMMYGNLPATLRMGMAVWGSGTLSDYRPSKGSAWWG